jgi:hypothetical protein
MVLTEGEGRARRLGALVALGSSAGVQGVQWGGGFIPAHALYSAAGATQCGQWIGKGGDRMSDKRARDFLILPKISIADFDSMLKKNS